MYLEKTIKDDKKLIKFKREFDYLNYPDFYEKISPILKSLLHERNQHFIFDLRSVKLNHIVFNIIYFLKVKIKEKPDCDIKIIMSKEDLNKIRGLVPMDELKIYHSLKDIFV